VTPRLCLTAAVWIPLLALLPVAPGQPSAARAMPPHACSPSGEARVAVPEPFLEETSISEEDLRALCPTLQFRLVEDEPAARSFVDSGQVDWAVVSGERPSEDASLLVEIPRVPVVPWSSPIRRLSMEELGIALSDPASGVALIPWAELSPRVRLVELEGIWNPYADPGGYPLLDRWWLIGGGDTPPPSALREALPAAIRLEGGSRWPRRSTGGARGGGGHHAGPGRGQRHLPYISRLPLRRREGARLPSGRRLWQP